MDRSVPPGAAILLDFIGSIEAPKGYGTVYGNNQAKLPKPLTSMSFAEVVAAGPGWTRTFGSSACGRYQFMRNTLDAPKTAADLKGEMGLTGTELFDADLQDRMALHLLRRRGYDRFVSGRIGVVTFALALAQEWASFPVLKAVQGAHRKVARGETYYAGDRLNKALVPPERIEAVLAQVLAASGAAAPVPPAAVPLPVPPPVIQAPRVEAEPPAPVALPWWQRLFGVKPKPVVAAVSRPGLAPHGDPALWDVQSKLKARAYYTKGSLDGLDGGMTQSAVAQSRKDNGMGDGGIDADFLARIDSFPQRPVSDERLHMSLPAAAAHAPELFKPPGWLVSAGLGSLGLGGVSANGLLDNVQTAVAKGNDVFGQVQSVFALLSTVVAFVVEHKTWFLVAVGLFLVWKGVSAILGAWIKVRQAFF